MPRRGENIYKRKDGRWEGRYKCGLGNDGRAKYKSVYSKTYSSCREKLAAAKNEACNSRQPAKLKMTIKSLFDEWLKSISIRIKKTTFDIYKGIIEKHIYPTYENVPICKITAESLNSFIAEKLKSGRIDKKGGLSEKTVLNIAGVIKSAFKYAERLYGAANPANLLILPKINKKRIQVLSDSDIEIIKKHCSKNGDFFSLAFDLCLSTGIRIGELCALKCSDIDFENGILKISKTVQRVKEENSDKKTQVVIGAPKTKNSVREIPLTDDLLKKLTEYTENKSADEFLFSPDGKKPFDVRTVQKRFEKVLNKCGIKKVKFHIIRHTFATKWANSSFDIKALSEILGHSSVNITLSLYVHSSMEMKRKCINSMFAA